MAIEYTKKFTLHPAAGVLEKRLKLTNEILAFVGYVHGVHLSCLDDTLFKDVTEKVGAISHDNLWDYNSQFVYLAADMPIKTEQLKKEEIILYQDSIIRSANVYNIIMTGHIKDKRIITHDWSY